MKVKTRFAPSPTGYMHLGNVRTALFSALYAIANQGDFLLRIEDTDLERSKKEYEDELMRDLKWLGLHWQEGPGKDLGHGPYHQSLRDPIYEKYYQELIEKGMAFPCFCSEQQLAITRKTQLAAGKPPRYPGTCRSLTKDDIAQKISAGEKPTLRFRVPAGNAVEFNDFVKGAQHFNVDDIGDFIIRRTDGVPIFMFCNAIDDALMGVTHVVRGEDHVTNTPRQILILQALNLAIPVYGHISLILGYDGAPLSKRHGSSSIADMRAMGVLPEALINYLARLGHYYEENDFFSLQELATKFKLECLSKSPAKFDLSQLQHWQKLAVSKLSEEAFWEWIKPEVENIVPDEKRSLFIEAIQPNIEFPKEAAKWASCFFQPLDIADAEKLTILKEAKKVFFESAIDALKQFGPDIKQMTSSLKEKLGINGKALFMPLRIALTGETHGPELNKIAELLGEEKIRERLSRAIIKE